MTQRNSSQNSELTALVKRFEEMKNEQKTLYLDTEQYEDIIEFYLYKKEYKNAIFATEMGLKIHPDSTKLIAMRVALYIDEDKIEEARETLNKVLGENSFHVRLINAELLIVEGKEEEAKEIFDSFEEDETDEFDCLDIGVLCNDIGFNDKALYWLKKCLTFNPENEDAILTLCECYQSMGEHEQTIELYNKLIDKDPYSTECWAGLGKSYFYLGQFNKAVEACDFALVSDDKAGEAYAVKGHAYYQLENFRESIEAYKEAWRLGSLEAEFAPMFIAFNYIGMREWDNAYEYIKKAIARIDEKSPVFSDLLINSARCLFHMKMHKEAHSTLELAQERFPDNVVAYIYNGKYYLKEGNIDKAVENFKKAVAISPTADIWYEIGMLAMNVEEYELAREAFSHVEDIDPEYEDLALNMIFVANKLHGGKHLKVSRKLLKEQLRKLVETTGERPETIDIADFVLRAKEAGQSESDIFEMTTALEELNDLLEHFDVDQEEDEIKDIE